ncbi:hypothetical protein BH24ACT5_BH24ACT5_01450 [soil metagenome]
MVGARGDLLVLASVKSFFGSAGVKVREVLGKASGGGGYRLLNDVALRDQIVHAAAERYGYEPTEVELRLYAGKFAATKAGEQEAAIRAWAATQIVGSGPIKIYGIDQIVKLLEEQASRRTYRDDPVIVTLKALYATGNLQF